MSPNVWKMGANGVNGGKGISTSGVGLAVVFLIFFS
jgi:hypothetical protein